MSIYSDSVRSPLEHVFRQFIPQGDNTALRNAFYNVAAVVFVAAVGAAAWNVYLIFQPFLRPLLWAVLCGSLLHPIKYNVTAWLRSWLTEVKASNSLLSISLAFLPLRFFDNLSELIVRFVMSHVKGVVTVTVLLPMLYIVIHHTPTALSSLAYTILSASAYVFTTLLTVITSYYLIFLTLVLGYIIAVSLWWSEETQHKLKSLSFPMWLVLAAAVSGSLSPSCSVIVFVLICLMLLGGACIEVMDVYNNRKLREGDDVSLLETALLVCGPGENGSLDAILGNTEDIDTSQEDDDDEGEDASGVEEIKDGEMLGVLPTIAEDQATEEELDSKEQHNRATKVNKNETKEDKKEHTEKKEAQDIPDSNKTSTNVPNVVVSSYDSPAQTPRSRPQLIPSQPSHSVTQPNNTFNTPSRQPLNQTLTPLKAENKLLTPLRQGITTPTHPSRKRSVVGEIYTPLDRVRDYSRRGSVGPHLGGTGEVVGRSGGGSIGRHFQPQMKTTIVVSQEIRDGSRPNTPNRDDLYSTPSLNTPRPKNLLTIGTPSRAMPPHTPYTPDHGGGHHGVEMADNNSTVYMKGVFVSCILVELWRHNYLLPLLPMAMIYYFIKKFASRYISWSVIRESVAVGKMEEFGVDIHQWLKKRRAVFQPAPIRGVVKLCVRTDHSCVQVLISVLDAVVTLLLILAVIFFTVVFSLYLAVQIQGESMHLVSLGSAVINSTMVSNPEFLKLLPEGMDEVVSSALDDAYLYGRGWIQSMVRGMLGETDDAKAAMLEKQVVELWDRVYQAWVAAHPQAPYRGPVVNSEAVAISFGSLLEGLKSPGAGTEYRSEVVSFSFLSEVVRDNLGTVMSVLESVWAILLGNLSLAASTLTAATSVLLMGSLSLINALINGVVFMSALFYVLSVSDYQYKPVAILSNLAPGQMNKLGGSVEQAINGVFLASMRMGAFYGMWTWLMHTIFATNIVYIPSVLGALFGAVPLVGTYWAAVPGCVELCWGHGSPTLAALLFAVQLLPMSCVDTAIYSDIKGGGHPYLTGLAVAGGIFCWGAEGAILGPLLLCILLVATNMYSTLIQSPHDRRYTKLRRALSIH